MSDQSPPSSWRDSGVKQRWYQRKLLLLPVALLVGVLIGSGVSSSDESSEPVADSSAAPTPETVVETVTETVTETVDAPTPTSETVTETVEKTVEKTPQSCIDALDQAAIGFNLAAKSIGQIGRLIPLFPKTLNAGFDQDVQAIRDITSQIKNITANIKDLNNKVQQAGDTARPLTAECRAK